MSNQFFQYSLYIICIKKKRRKTIWGSKSKKKNSKFGINNFFPYLKIKKLTKKTKQRSDLRPDLHWKKKSESHTSAFCLHEWSFTAIPSKILPVIIFLSLNLLPIFFFPTYFLISFQSSSFPHIFFSFFRWINHYLSSSFSFQQKTGTPSLVTEYVFL